MLATRALVTFKCQMTGAEAKKSSFPAQQKERGRLCWWDTGLALGTPMVGTGTAGLRCRMESGSAALGSTGDGHGSGQGSDRGTGLASQQVTSPTADRAAPCPTLVFGMETSSPAFPPEPRCLHSELHGLNLGLQGLPPSAGE